MDNLICKIGKIWHILADFIRVDWLTDPDCIREGYYGLFVLVMCIICITVLINIKNR